MSKIYKNKSVGTVNAMVKQHYRDIAQSAALCKDVPQRPKEGWIRSIRKALGMSGAQLAQRLNLSRNRISVLERREADGDVTINQLREVAEQLGCQLSYVLVPQKSVKQMLGERAEQLADEALSANAQNMQLEAQSLSPEKQMFLKEQLKNEFLNAGGRVLWKNDKGAVNTLAY